MFLTYEVSEEAVQCAGVGVEILEFFWRAMHAQFHKVGNRFLLRSSLLQCQPAHRIPVPERVSLVCMDADPTFAWCVPAISHIRWDSGSVVRRIVRWAATVNRDRNDVRQTLPPAKFVPDGTIAPAAAGSER